MRIVQGKQKKGFVQQRHTKLTLFSVSVHTFELKFPNTYKFLNYFNYLVISFERQPGPFQKNVQDRVGTGLIFFRWVPVYGGSYDKATLIKLKLSNLDKLLGNVF